MRRRIDTKKPSRLRRLLLTAGILAGAALLAAGILRPRCR